MILFATIVCYAVSSLSGLDPDTVSFDAFKYSDESCPLCRNIERFPDACNEDEDVREACKQDQKCHRIILKKKMKITGSNGKTTQLSFFCASASDFDMNQLLNNGVYSENVAGVGTDPTPSVSSTTADSHTVDVKSCVAGETKVGEQCEKCPVNTYSDTADAVECILCPDDEITEEIASDSSDDCKNGAIGLSTGVLSLLLVFFALV